MTTDATFVFTIIVGLSMSTSASVHERRTFEGYSVLRLLPQSEGQVRFLKSLADTFDVEPDKTRQVVDFWKRPKAINESVDVMLSPDILPEVARMMSANKIKSRVMVQNVENLLKSERQLASMEERQELLYMNRSWIRNGNANSFFADYHRLNEIHDFMNELSTTYPNRVKVRSLGKSHEGRDLLYWIITNNNNNGNKDKPIIWVDSGIHAREWISPATGLFMATQLITRADSDPTFNNLLDIFEFHMLPVSNPDGYEHTHINDRMWRKTRSRSGRGGWDLVCRGTDPNRNWGFHWNEAGSSSHPCSDIYAGPSAFSEPETKAMSDYIMRNRDKIISYISLHSYSQLILTPWGWTRDLPAAYPDMERIALSAARALKSLYGTEYTVGSSTRVLYEAAGGSDDWAHGAAGIKYSYTVELRDTGDHGFVLPKEQIIPTGEETLLLLVDMAHSFAVERGLLES